MMKLIYIVPHLSTGGMPEVLRMRIQVLQQRTDVDVWVLEYSQYSTHFINQRNEIIQMVGNDQFISLGEFGTDDATLERKYNAVRELLERENFDVIHFDDIPESYDSFNPFAPKLLDYIYGTHRTWVVVETCHNSYFNANIDKRANPDGFMFCSKYHPETTFSNLIKDIPYAIVEYPIYDRSAAFLPTPNEFNRTLFNVINVGIWTPGKNQKEALGMTRYLNNTKWKDDIMFHFIGGLAPNFKNYWEPLIADLPDNVTIWGVQNDVRPFFQHADVVLFNSNFELNPIILKEAVGFGKKILMRDLPVYYGAYSNYATYLTGDTNEDVTKLLSLLGTPYTYSTSEFGNKQLTEMADNMMDFYTYMESKMKTTDIKTKAAPIKFGIDFTDGAYCEIIGNDDDVEYNLKFINKKTNQIVYESNIRSHYFSRTSLKYFIDYQIRIKDTAGKYDEIIYNMDLNSNRVVIRFESKALGDTLAWIPYVEEFRKKHNCTVFCSTFHNYLFEEQYPDINFINPKDDTPFNIYAKYHIGWFRDNNDNIDLNRHPTNVVNQPLQKTASDILGLEFKEIRPTIKSYTFDKPLPVKYFTFSIQSTAQCKYWNYPDGWNILLHKLASHGYVGICIDKHREFGNVNYMNKVPPNCIDKTNLSLEDAIAMMDKADFHIGTSSGISWLAWALGKKVVLISGFTDPILEFSEDCIRVHNLNVCNGCFTNPIYKFNPSDWEWCPVYKGTDYQFECSATITPDDVFNKMKKGGLI